MIAPGTVVQWWDRSTGGRRIGTVASVRSTRRGDVLRIMQGDGSTNEPALFMASRNARGVVEFPASEVAPYVRRHWPAGAHPSPATDDPEPPPPPAPLVFIEARDLAHGGDGSPLTLL